MSQWIVKTKDLGPADKPKRKGKRFAVIESEKAPKVPHEKSQDVKLHFRTGGQPDMTLVRAPEMQAIQPTSKVRCYFPDSGCRPDHTAFASLISGSYDAVTGGPVTKDELAIVGGHGTRGVSVTAGKYGAVTAAPLYPMNWVNFADVDSHLGNLIDCFEWMLDQHPSGTPGVVRCSWGFDDDSPALRSLIVECDARGLVVLATTGNTYQDLSVVPMYPASYAGEFRNVLAIAGCDYQLDRPVNTGIGGATSIFAPAWPGIWGADARSTNGETGQSGVSHHCLQGIVAAVWERNPVLTHHQVVDVIKRSAHKAPQYVGCTSGGRVDALAAIELATRYEAEQPPLTGTYTVGAGSTLIVRNGLICGIG